MEKTSVQYGREERNEINGAWKKLFSKYGQVEDNGTQSYSNWLIHHLFSIWFNSTNTYLKTIKQKSLLTIYIFLMSYTCSRITWSNFLSEKTNMNLWWSLRIKNFRSINFAFNEPETVWSRNRFFTRYEMFDFCLAVLLLWDK